MKSTKSLNLEKFTFNEEHQFLFEDLSGFDSREATALALVNGRNFPVQVHGEAIIGARWEQIPNRKK